MFQLRFPCRLTAIVVTLCLTSTAALAGVPTTVYVSSSIVCDYPTIQAAINGVASGSEIRLVGNEFALPATLNVVNRRLTIRGGYPACGAPDPTSTTTLNAGFSGGPVLDVFGSAIESLRLDLRDLSIIGADNPTGNGGGLVIAGQGVVNLLNVDVLDNTANDGGGMYLQSSPPGALTLNLIAGTRIGASGAGNAALGVGGGLYCNGARVRLGAVEISGNTAGAAGGGVRAFNACQLLSILDVGDTRIDGNTGSDGAGIYASLATVINLQSRPGQRLSISGNLAQGAASPSGGGVYLTSAGTEFTAHGAWIENNQAQLAGAGLFVTGGAKATLDRGVDACAVGDDQCSRLSGNGLRNADGSPSGNGAGVFASGSSLTISHTRIEGNSAQNGAVLRANGAVQVTLDNVLISNNLSAARLINIEGTATARVDFATIVDNDFVGAAVNVISTAPTALELSRSIFLVLSGRTHIQGAGSSLFACLNTGDGGALGGDAHMPAFFDATAGIYRLASDSLNLDRCAADGNESEYDIGGLPRNLDRPGVANNVGPLDRGAYEDVEGLLTDGFED